MAGYERNTLQYLKVATRYLEYVSCKSGPTCSYIFHRKENASHVVVFPRFLREAPRASRFTDVRVRITFAVLLRCATSGNKVDGISQVRPFRLRDKSQFRIRDVGEIVRARSFSASSSFSLGKRHRHRRRSSFHGPPGSPPAKFDVRE